MRFADKIAVITGAGSGIGRATASRLVDEGARVVLGGRSQERLDAVVADLGAGAIAVVGDVTDQHHIDELIDTAARSFGGLDVVIANAGVSSSGAIDALDDDEWHSTLDVNLHGPMRLARGAFPALRARGGGAIVLVASVNGIVNTPNSAAYDISKAALISMARALAIDGGQHNIRANALCPGWVATPMADRDMDLVAQRLGISRTVAYLRATQHTPMRRIATPGEIASCCAFLASDDASFVTGTTLVADGGGLAVDVTGLTFGDASP